MHVISFRKIREFYSTPSFSDSEGALKPWYDEAKNANWESPHDIKEKYASASFVNNNRVVFNICGNKYRLVVRINYGSKTVFIRFINTHEEYDKIDVSAI